MGTIGICAAADKGMGEIFGFSGPGGESLRLRSEVGGRRSVGEDGFVGEDAVEGGAADA